MKGLILRTRALAALGVYTGPLFSEAYSNSYLMVLRKRSSNKEWEQMVQYYRDSALGALPPQVPPAQPTIDSIFPRAEPFIPRMKSSTASAGAATP
jgi:hypothetical protein